MRNFGTFLWLFWFSFWSMWWFVWWYVFVLIVYLSVWLLEFRKQINWKFGVWGRRKLWQLRSVIFFLFNVVQFLAQEYVKSCKDFFTGNQKKKNREIYFSRINCGFACFWILCNCLIVFGLCGSGFYLRCDCWHWKDCILCIYPYAFLCPW